MAGAPPAGWPVPRARACGACGWCGARRWRRRGRRARRGILGLPSTAGRDHADGVGARAEPLRGREQGADWPAAIASEDVAGRRPATLDRAVPEEPGHLCRGLRRRSEPQIDGVTGAVDPPIPLDAAEILFRSEITRRKSVCPREGTSWSSSFASEPPRSGRRKLTAPGREPASSGRLAALAAGISAEPVAYLLAAQRDDRPAPICSSRRCRPSSGMPRAVRNARTEVPPERTVRVPAPPCSTTDRSFGTSAAWRTSEGGTTSEGETSRDLGRRCGRAGAGSLGCSTARRRRRAAGPRCRSGSARTDDPAGAGGWDGTHRRPS